MASPGQTNEPADPFSCHPGSSPANGAGVATDSSSHSVNVSGPTTPTHENLPENMSGMSKIKALQPYAIEEPDDDPEPPVQRRLELPCLPDYFEVWQRELIDRIDDMDDADDKAVTKSSAKLSPIPKRGQKRKPLGAASAADYHTGSYRSKSRAKLDDPALPICGMSPKRRRRRSKVPEESPKSPHPISLHDFRDTRVNQSSSSDLLSSSSTDSVDDSALVDEMDID
ncbi:uncharacterized protein N7496_005018 [Penicillium cataractarum]|uniref:Uncharacterized protein n=1 Tax=Penicillium cataractarum TaxID=2100454 RepID=A0A9W9SH79_9EURO|nr:uncharacterized protein N7496_005018 [Penicillium cataractarum]KAJ5377609.1 hypothetical protein N7496_005018 [Penicillium cataractarum]